MNNVRRIAASDYHSCLISLTGATFCSGNDDGGLLGNPDDWCQLTPTEVAGIL